MTDNPLDKYATTPPPAPASVLVPAPATSVPVPAASVPAATTPAAANPLEAKLAELAKRNESAGATLVPTTPATTPAAAPTSVPLPSLAGVKNPALKQALAATQEEAAKAEAAKITSTGQEVPEGIYQLDSGIEKIEGLNAAEFANHLAATYTTLHTDQAGLAGMLEAINKNMRQYEELAYLMTEEQLGLYVQGLMAVTNAEIKTVKPKKTAASIQQQIAREGAAKDFEM